MKMESSSSLSLSSSQEGMQMQMAMRRQQQQSKISSMESELTMLIGEEALTRFKQREELLCEANCLPFLEAQEIFAQLEKDFAPSTSTISVLTGGGAFNKNAFQKMRSVLCLLLSSYC